MTPYDTEVAIVGAGPTGLALACELRLGGVDCQVLERRTDEPNITRAFAVHSRTLELLDARGMADDLVPQGIIVPEVQPAPGAFLRLSILHNKYPFVLIVPQSRTEKMLEQRATELGAKVVRGEEVTGLTQDDDGVTLTIGNGKTLRARYVVGTDGAHSAVRRLIGVDFAGKEYQTHILLADVQLERPPQDTLFGVTNHKGLVLFVPFGDSWFRAIVWDRTREDVPLSEPVTLDELKESFHRIAGDDYGMGEPRWRTRFLSERRQARRYRVGRVFLAGDAAHVHSPVGGQGMNTGIQDAMNLGWKLAQALKGGPDLLDTYEAERHPVGESVLKLTDALVRLVLSGSEFGASMRRLLVRVLLKVPTVRQMLAERLSGIGIHYGSDRQIGHRVPDSPTANGRIYEQLRSGKFLVVGDGPYVLVRPDGYVAWAGKDRDGLAAAQRKWCGANV